MNKLQNLNQWIDKMMIDQTVKVLQNQNLMKINNILNQDLILKVKTEISLLKIKGGKLKCLNLLLLFFNNIYN